MIKAILSTIVGNMDVNGDTFTLLMSSKEIQNLKADEKNFPVVFVDIPIRYVPKIRAGGGFERDYLLTAMFLYKSQIDDNEDQQYATEQKAEAAQREFQLRLQQAQHDGILRSYTVGTCYEIPHEFDAILSGIVQPFTALPMNSESVCLT